MNVSWHKSIFLPKRVPFKSYYFKHLGGNNEWERRSQVILDIKIIQQSKAVHSHQMISWKQFILSLQRRGSSIENENFDYLRNFDIKHRKHNKLRGGTCSGTNTQKQRIYAWCALQRTRTWDNHLIYTSSCSIVWPRGIIIWLPVNLVGLIPGYAYEPAFKEAAE